MQTRTYLALLSTIAGHFANTCNIIMSPTGVGLPILVVRVHLNLGGPPVRRRRLGTMTLLLSLSLSSKNRNIQRAAKADCPHHPPTETQTITFFKRGCWLDCKSPTLHNRLDCQCTQLNPQTTVEPFLFYDRRRDPLGRPSRLQG